MYRHRLIDMRATNSRPLSLVIFLVCTLYAHILSGQEMFDFSSASSGTKQNNAKQSNTKHSNTNHNHSTQTVSHTNSTMSKPYRLLPLLHQYQGEEAKGILYFDVQQRDQMKVSIHQGLMWIKGKLVNPKYVAPSPLPTPLPEALSHTQNLQNGFAIYVMDQNGHFYVSFQAQKYKVHHSSLLAGAAVACAGEMMIYQGKIYYINNKSGHYKPPPAALRQALHALREKNIDLSHVKIDFLGVDL